jgi:hypothetical protein
MTPNAIDGDISSIGWHHWLSVNQREKSKQSKAGYIRVMHWFSLSWLTCEMLLTTALGKFNEKRRENLRRAEGWRTPEAKIWSYLMTNDGWTNKLSNQSDLDSSPSNQNTLCQNEANRILLLRRQEYSSHLKDKVKCSPTTSAITSHRKIRRKDNSEHGASSSWSLTRRKDTYRGFAFVYNR